MILIRLRRFDRKPNADRYYSPPCGSALRARVTFVSDSAQDGTWHDGTRYGHAPEGPTRLIHGASLERRTILAATVAPMTAIVVFRVIYGSPARPLIGAGAAMLTSLLIFSGTVQFTIAGLLSAGAGAGLLWPDR
jgi:hypothetical protein